MHDFFDRLENRTPAARETSLLRDLAHVLTVSRPRAPGLRAQLRGIGAGPRSRAELRGVPIRRRADLVAAQAELPPFGGHVATRIGALAQAFAAPGAPLSPGGLAKDWWGLGRALYAAGLRRGALLLNAMPYDLAPDGHMVEAGARAVGCPVIPAGNADVAAVAAAAERLRPSFFCGAPDRLKRLLDAGTCRSIEAALLLGPLKPGLRAEFGLRGIAVRRAFTLPELGAIGYETGDADALVLAERYLLEIVDAGGHPVADGEDGEVVVSRINLDYPLLRFGTGLVSRLLPGSSACGRTNARFAMPRPAAAMSAAVACGAGELPRERPSEALRVALRRHGAVEIAAPAPTRDAAPIRRA